MRVYRHENPNLTNLYLDVSADYQNWFPVAGKYDTGGAAAWWTIGGVYTGYVRFARVRVSRNSGCHSEIMTEHLEYEIDSIRILGRQTSLPDRMMFSIGSPKIGTGDPRECFLKACTGAQLPAGDPINTYTGGLDYSVVDLALNTQAGPLTFQRSYSSLTTSIYTTPLGLGWTHNQDLRLLLESDGAWFKAHTANQYHFIKAGSLYLPDAGVLAQLTHPDDNTYILSASDQSVYTFDQFGKITTWTDPLEKTFTYTYDSPNGHLTRVSDSSGQRYLDLHYQVPGYPDLISSVSDHTGRAVSFSYTGDLLTGFIDANQKTWTYLYDNDNLLNKVKDPQQNVVMHTAYQNGKAVAQYQGDAATPEKKILGITYGTNGTITVTDALSNSQILAYDDRHTLIGQTVTDQNITVLSASAKTYDQNFRPATTQNSDDPATQLTWSPDGTNLTAIQDASGNQTHIAYDELNRPTEITPPQGATTTFTYTGNLLTSSTQSADGVNYTTTYTYTTAADAPEPPNLLRSTTDPLQHTTTYQYDELGQLISTTDAGNRTTTFAYDSLGRQIALTGPDGIITRTYYNSLDQITSIVRNLVGQTIENGTPPAFDPDYPDQNVRTDYFYDSNGNQIAAKQVRAINGDGLVSRLYYDTNNRLVTSIQNFVSAALDDPAPVYNPAYPDQNIRTDYFYDANGNQIAVKLWTDASGNGRINRTYYDGLNRPISTVENLVGQNVSEPNPPTFNPANSDQNVRTDYFYDVTGNQIATKQWTALDGSGIYTRTYYDVLNRPATIIQNFVSAALTDDAPAYDPIHSDQNVRTDFFYDVNGNQIASKLWKAANGSGLITRTYYDVFNRPVTTVQNLVGQTIDYPTPPAFNPTYPDQNVRVDSFYDAGSNVMASKRWKDASGNGIISRTYLDAINRPILAAQNFISASITDPAPAFNPDYPDQNVQTQTFYADGGQVQKTVDPNGRVLYLCYDGLGRQVKQIINPTVSDPCQDYSPSAVTDRDIIARARYDAAGNRQSTTDPNGKTTTYEYDAIGRLTRQVDPLQNVTQFSYDVFGNQINIENAKHVSNHFEFDGMGRLSAVIENYRPGVNPTTEINVRTEYRYNAQGNLTEITDARGYITTLTYNPLGDLIGEENALDHIFSYTYTASGNRASLTDANGATTYFAYDGLDRLIGIDYPDPDADVSFTYDALGNRHNMTDGTGTTTWTYDGLGRATNIQDGNNQTVGYGYDAAGNRTKLTYPGNQDVTYEYDNAGRMKLVTGWDSLTTEYTWDKGGRLSTVNLPNNIVSMYRYDDANRLANLIHITSDDQILSSFDYTYDEIGNRVQVTEAVLPHRFFLPMIINDCGLEPCEASSTSEQLGQSALDGFDSTLNPYPAPGEESLDSLESESEGTGPTDSSGYPVPDQAPTPQSSISLWNQVVNFFKDLLQPQSVSASAPVTASFVKAQALLMPIKSVPVAYNQAQTVDSEILQIAYQYDPLNRLKEANYSDGSYFHYIYDEVGNRLSETTLNSTKSYIYDEASRLTSVNGTTYTWDNNGNLLSDGNQSYAYDHENRLKSVVDGAETYSYGYNGHGDRVRQTINGVTTSYLLDINAGLTQVLSDETNTYFYGMNRIARYAGAQPQFYLGDALDSVRQVTDINDAVLLAQSFDPFGNPLKHQGIETSSFGYAGEHTDQTGLQFLRARYYSSQLGRFLTRDTYPGTPLQPASLNIYSYGLNNPVLYNDPSGHYVCAGYNEKWGAQTCYDKVNGWLDYLYKYGGDEGESLVKQFMEADGKYPVRIEFVSSVPGGAVAQANPLYNMIKVSLNSGIDVKGLGYESGSFAHELVHLLRQSSPQQGTTKAEKEAYDVTAKVMTKMGVELPPTTARVSSMDNLDEISSYLGTSSSCSLIHIIGDPVARVLLVTWESITGCYGNVCMGYSEQWNGYQFTPSP